MREGKHNRLKSRQSRAGAALLLPRLIGEWGVYIAEIMAWIGAAILLIWGYYRRMRLLERKVS